MAVTRIVPILKVSDISAALEFYCERLGFVRDFHYTASATAPAYAGVSLDGHQLHLSTFAGDGVTGTAAYVYVDDVDALVATLRARGLPILVRPDSPVEENPVDQTWGMREFYVRDPDGNTVRFGSPMPSAARNGSDRPALTSANGDDARGIAELHLASWRATYTRELTPGFHERQDVAAKEAEWRHHFANGVRVIVAKDGRRLDGFVACGPVRGPAADSREWEIYNLHVAPARHGAGLGSRLFDAAVALGRQHGAQQLVLWVVDTNTSARTFYERKGMTPDGGKQDHVLDDESLREVRYRMNL